MPKSMIFGVVVLRPGDEDVPWLQVAMDDPLLMGVQDSVAHLLEEGEPSLDVEGVDVAELRDREAGNELRHEVRSAVIGRPGVVDPDDVPVVHRRQNLLLEVKPAEDLPGPHSRLQDLERHPLPELTPALREVDLSERARAQEPVDPVGSDDRAGIEEPYILGKEHQVLRLVDQEALDRLS